MKRKKEERKKSNKQTAFMALSVQNVGTLPVTGELLTHPAHLKGPQNSNYSNHQG